MRVKPLAFKRGVNHANKLFNWSAGSYSTSYHTFHRRFRPVNEQYSLGQNHAVLTGPQLGTEIPTYQAYLCLAWLRGAALIEQHGRQGYSVPAAAQLAGLAVRRFEQLARR